VQRTSVWVPIGQGKGDIANYSPCRIIHDVPFSCAPEMMPPRTTGVQSSFGADWPKGLRHKRSDRCGRARPSKAVPVAHKKCGNGTPRVTRPPAR